LLLKRGCRGSCLIWTALSNGFAVKLPAPTCTRRAVWSMTWCEDPPATHLYARRKRRPASSAGYAAPAMREGPRRYRTAESGATGWKLCGHLLAPGRREPERGVVAKRSLAGGPLRAGSIFRASAKSRRRLSGAGDVSAARRRRTGRRSSWTPAAWKGSCCGLVSGVRITTLRLSCRRQSAPGAPFGQ
jgi:hypothetical protein